MKMVILSTIKKIIAIALIGVLAMITINNAAFYHFHKQPDGSIIAHAHPYSKSNHNQDPIQSHKHTQKEFFFFDRILLLFSVGLMFISCLLFAAKPIEQVYYRSAFLENSPQIVFNKAPPIFFRLILPVFLV
jgi:hypothetical protein